MRRSPVALDAVGRADSAVVLLLPYAASSVRVARRRLGEYLSDLPREVVDDARTVVSELVGNAVRHASPLPSGRIKVSWDRQDSDLTVGVTDGGGPTTPMAANVPPNSPGGRGLSIVRSLAEDWEVQRAHGTTTVVARMQLPGHRPPDPPGCA